MTRGEEKAKRTTGVLSRLRTIPRWVFLFFVLVLILPYGIRMGRRQLRYNGAMTICERKANAWYFRFPQLELLIIEVVFFGAVLYSHFSTQSDSESAA